MIVMIKGTYTHPVEGLYVDETPQTGPFRLSEKEEEHLVAKGCAKYVQDPNGSAPSGSGKKKKKKAMADGI